MSFRLGHPPRKSRRRMEPFLQPEQPAWKGQILPEVRLRQKYRQRHPTRIAPFLPEQEFPPSGYPPKEMLRQAYSDPPEPQVLPFLQSQKCPKVRKRYPSLRFHPSGIHPSKYRSEQSPQWHRPSCVPDHRTRLRYPFLLPKTQGLKGSRKDLRPSKLLVRANPFFLQPARFLPAPAQTFPEPFQRQSPRPDPAEELPSKDLPKTVPRLRSSRQPVQQNLPQKRYRSAEHILLSRTDPTGPNHATTGNSSFDCLHHASAHRHRPSAAKQKGSMDYATTQIRKPE